MAKPLKVLPVLSEKGWVTDSKDILHYLISYYILSDAAQSIAYQNNITNLPETYYKYINDPEEMAIGVKNDLDRLLSRYFASVDVETEAKELDNKKYAILLYVSVMDYDNVRHELARVTTIDSSGLRKIINVNNYGNGLAYLQSL